MKEYTQRFFEVAFEYEALKLGRFLLKSGRVSPYFFNLGDICSGKALEIVADCYVQVLCSKRFITEESLPVLFGPAYKGISLVTAITLSLLGYGENASFAFCRKEEKEHGEAGLHIGKSLDGCPVLVVDDVVSGGETVRDTLAFVRKSRGIPVGVVVGLDRQEREVGNGQSVIQRMRQELDVPIESVAKFSDLCEFVSQHQKYHHYLPLLEGYRQEFCVAS